MNETQACPPLQGKHRPPMASMPIEAAATARRVTCPPSSWPDARRKESKLNPLQSQAARRSLFASLDEWPQVYDLLINWPPGDNSISITLLAWRDTPGLPASIHPA